MIKIFCATKIHCLTSTTHHNLLREKGDWGPQFEVQYYQTIDNVMKFAFSNHPDMSLRGEYTIYFECQSMNWMIYVEFHFIVSFSLQYTLIFIEFRVVSKVLVTQTQCNDGAILRWKKLINISYTAIMCALHMTHIRLWMGSDMKTRLGSHCNYCQNTEWAHRRHL